MWTTVDSTKVDIEYVVSVLSPEATVSTTNQTHLNLTLTEDIEYTITVLSQRCDGKLKSNSSDPLHIFLTGVIESVCLYYMLNKCYIVIYKLK